MSAFEKVTAISGTGGTYTAELDPQWTVDGRPNGGYLLATMARAALATDAESTHPHPLSASVLYASSPVPGPAEIEVEALRRGRSASQLRVRLSQQGTARVEALFVVGRL